MADRATSRKSWRIDLKWVASIITVFLLLPTLFSFQMWNLTSEDQARSLITGAADGVMTEFLADSFKGKYTELQTFIRSNPSAKLPLEFPVTITNNDILKSGSIDELVTVISDRMFEQIYRGEGVELSGQTTEQIPALAVIVPILNFLSEATHNAMRQIFIFTLIGAIIFAIPSLLFSYRWGRLMTLGAVVAVPGLVVASIVSGLGALVTQVDISAGSLVVVKDLIGDLLANASFASWLVFWIALGVFVIGAGMSYLWKWLRSKSSPKMSF